MKSIYYVVTAVQAHRQAIDYYGWPPEEKVSIPNTSRSFARLATEPYYWLFEHKTTATHPEPWYTSSYTQLYDFCGVVQSYDPETYHIQQRNKINAGETIEVMVAGPRKVFTPSRWARWRGRKGKPTNRPHPKMILTAWKMMCLWRPWI